jgi:ABC-type sugar transport system substrate-binding protein
VVELILARPANLDRFYLEQFLRHDTGVKKCAFRVVSPKDTEPFSPGQLATEIRTAANRSTGVLILEPIDAPEVRKAVQDAVEAGLPVVLLDTPLPPSSSGKPYPLVTFKGFADAGKQLVQVVTDDAKLMRLPADGTTLVIENRDKDPYSRDRLESMTGALKAAGRAYDLVSFQGEQKEASEVVMEYLESHPKVTVILADQDLGLAGAFNVREEARKNATSIMFALGGYSACDARLAQTVKDQTQGLVDRNVEGYARKAFQIAMDLMDGKPAPERTELDLRFIHNPPPSNLPPETAETRKKKAMEASEALNRKLGRPAGTGSEPKKP